MGAQGGQWQGLYGLSIGPFGHGIGHLRVGSCQRSPATRSPDEQPRHALILANAATGESHPAARCAGLSVAVRGQQAKMDAMS